MSAGASGRKRPLTEPVAHSEPKRGDGRDKIYTAVIMAPLPANLAKHAHAVHMDETPAEYVESLVVGLMKEQVREDTDHTSDPRALFEERVRKKAINLEGIAARELKAQAMEADGGERPPPLRAGAKLSAKEQRVLDREALKGASTIYAAYEPLHALWLGYMRDLLNFESPSISEAGAQQKLAKADMHGALITVVRATCASLVGARGIVVQETCNTFVIVTLANRLTRLPKANTVFSLRLGPLECTIYGNHFCFKASERAVRKFKSKPTIDL